MFHVRPGRTVPITTRRRGVDNVACCAGVSNRYLHVDTPQDEASTYVGMARTIATQAATMSVSVYTQITDVERECDVRTARRAHSLPVSVPRIASPRPAHVCPLLVLRHLRYMFSLSCIGDTCLATLIRVCGTHRHAVWQAASRNGTDVLLCRHWLPCLCACRLHELRSHREVQRHAVGCRSICQPTAGVVRPDTGARTLG